MLSPTFRAGLSQFGSQRERPSSTLPVVVERERVIDSVDNSVLLEVTYRHLHASGQRALDEHLLFVFCAFSDAGQFYSKINAINRSFHFRVSHLLGVCIDACLCLLFSKPIDVMHRTRRGAGVRTLWGDALFNQLINAVVGCAVQCVKVVEDDMCNLHAVDIIPVGDRFCYRYIRLV